MDNTSQISSAKNKPLVAAIYARVSTGRQEQETTIESQIDELKIRIELDGNTLSSDNIFADDGWTGEMLKRPALDKMRDATIDGSFQILYVYDRGRISRVFAHQEIVIEELADKGIKFVTLHDVSADTPEARVLQSMQGVFHEYERVKIAERMRRGKLYKANHGIIISGNALYGYDYIKKTDKNLSAQWIINENEANVVCMIWKWVGIEGVSIRGVLKKLYELGIPPRKGKRNVWTKGPVIRMLQCKTYVSGVAHYNKSEAVVAKNPLRHDGYKKVKRTSRKMRPFDEWIPFTVPVLVSNMWLYEKIQKLLELNKKYANKKSKGKYLLTGRLYCQCGHRMNGDGCNKYGHYYYRCTRSIHKYPLESTCKARGINAKIMDVKFWQELQARMNDNTLLKQYAIEWLEARQDNNSSPAEVMTLQGHLEAVKQEEERYSKAYGIGSLEIEQFNTLMLDARKRRESIERRMTTFTKVEKQNPTPVEVDELVVEAMKVITDLDWDNKIATIRDIIDHVTVKEQTGVEVFVHLPMPTTQKLDYELENRYCRLGKRWKIHTFQCASQKASGVCG